MSWLPGLVTETPEEGFQLAIKLSRMAVKFTQPGSGSGELSFVSSR
ncbi:MAG: hexameric tyrosine-coordinated heme protein [Anderseniella sp.]